MKIHDITKFTKGWFIGDFEPTILRTNAFEVGVKRYRNGDFEKKHYHSIATEYTIIVEGEVSINGVQYSKDSIIEITPNEVVDFICLTDVITVVIKTPSVASDKYVI